MTSPSVPTAHEFCCGAGEQFFQQAEFVLWEHAPADLDCDAPAEMLTALLPLVLAYGNARAAEALEAVAEDVDLCCERIVTGRAADLRP